MDNLPKFDFAGDKMKAYYDLADTDKIDEFVKQADDINQKVKDIIDGKIDFDDLDRQEQEAQKIAKSKRDIEEREKLEKILKGRPGKGHIKGYKLFCRRCHTEYMIDTIQKCTHCSKELMTYEERMAELKEKLHDHQTKIQKKKMRRAKWENWKKTQAMFYCKTSTNYNKWNMFESESDSEKDESDPVVPNNDPQFKAMEQDFKDRSRRRVRDKKIAEELKIKGNEAMKRGLYKSAKHYYSEALEHKKDYLVIYTNRALACLKLEEPQQVIDDCSRVLEYCEVFDNGYEKQKDLCFKALMRRGCALKFQKDFKLAKDDFLQAQKIAIEGDKDPEKWLKLTDEDQEHQAKIQKIMSNAESLKGKDYIDYLIQFLRGKKDLSNQENSQKSEQKFKRKQICMYELNYDECQKLKKTLENQDMVYYFNVNEGFKVLVDSLYLSTQEKASNQILQLIQTTLEKNKKLQDDFQRDHLYEALIDFMQTMNQNHEGKTLAYNDMIIILQILETASMNDIVRSNLSDKKKIKDLFLVVVRSIEICKNKYLISSLIQFISNLCYGNGKLRQMLAREDSNEFFGTLRQILDQIKIDVKYEEPDDLEQQENLDPNLEKNFLNKEKADKSLLKSTMYTFLANLCIEKQLRINLANNQSQILSQLIIDFKNDIQEKKFDWVDIVYKQLAVFVNLGIEEKAQLTFIESGMVNDLEELLKQCKTSNESEKGILERAFNLLSKILRQKQAANQAVKLRHLVFKSILYMNKQFQGDLQQNALRTLHPLMKVEEGFATICYDQHKFTKSTFDNYSKELLILFNQSIGKDSTSNQQERDEKQQDWPLFINVCASGVAFLDAFPERVHEFKDFIIDLIYVIKEKTELVRKNAAILLAKIANDEELKNYIRANHGFDVLMSLRAQL